MKLNYDASNEVLKNLAEKLLISELELAEGILSIINAKMADAIRTITVKQGIDPREFTLVAFGGAAPMHGVWLAEELEINETIVPNDPGTFSAWGMLQTDIRKDVTVNFFHAFSNLNENKIINSFEKLKNEATDLLSQENVKESDMSFNLTADMRYIGQEYYVNVQINKPIKLEEINKCFHETYEKQYGHSTPDGPIEFINLRLVATGHIPKTSAVVKKYLQSSEVKENIRSVIFDNNKYDTTLLNRANIKSNKTIDGPVIIEEETATTVVPPKYNLKKDNFGNLIIKKNDDKSRSN
jgi:N-methylhydantoinase A